MEFPLILGETNFVEVPKICEIYGPQKKSALRYIHRSDNSDRNASNQLFSDYQCIKKLTLHRKLFIMVIDIRTFSNGLSN